MSIDATWVWVREDRPFDPVPAARFAWVRGVRTGWVSVPWGGPDQPVRSVADALRREGLTVTALGGSPDWAEHPDRAAEWAHRAVADGVFSEVHLDIEPWTLPRWPTDANRLLAGTASAVQQVADVTGAAAEVDLSPHLAVTHPEGYSAIGGVAGAVTLMTYRTTAASILALAEPAVRSLRAVGRPYRLAVDTLPSPDPHTTFAGRPTSYLDTVVTEVAGELATDPQFRGVAVHDLPGWLALTRGA